MQLSQYKKLLGNLVIACLVVIPSMIFAQTDTDTLGGMATQVTGSFEAIGTLFIACAYIAGFAITVFAIFKFKAHRDNPTQVTLGTPIALLVIGVLLVFIPSLFGPAGKSIFGTDASTGGFTGTGISVIEGT